MAQRVITQLVSDLSGDEMKVGEGETIEFTYRGQGYTIDLTDKEAKGFDKSIAMYLEHATKASGRKSSGRKSSAASGPAASDVRAWAKSNGHDLPERGRIPKDIKEAYEAAH